jgi:hypothetical protein
MARPVSELGKIGVEQFTTDEWQMLFRGEIYPAKLHDRDVHVNVNLAGICVLDPPTEEVIQRVDLLQVTQSICSTENSTITFSCAGDELNGMITLSSNCVAEMDDQYHILVDISTQLKEELKKGPQGILNQPDPDFPHVDPYNLRGTTARRGSTASLRELLLQQDEHQILTLLELGEDRYKLDINLDRVPPQKKEGVKKILERASDSDYCCEVEKSPKGNITALVFIKRINNLRDIFMEIRELLEPEDCGC